MVPNNEDQASFLQQIKGDADDTHRLQMHGVTWVTYNTIAEKIESIRFINRRLALLDDLLIKNRLLQKKKHHYFEQLFRQRESILDQVRNNAKNY